METLKFQVQEMNHWRTPDQVNNNEGPTLKDSSNTQWTLMIWLFSEHKRNH